MYEKEYNAKLRQRLTGSLCVCSCLALSDELENLLGHLSSSAYLQPKGLSPVCDLWWILRLILQPREGARAALKLEQELVILIHLTKP